MDFPMGNPVMSKQVPPAISLATSAGGALMAIDQLATRW